jgi:hypothetical protein
MAKDPEEVPDRPAGGQELPCDVDVHDIHG